MTDKGCDFGTLMKSCGGEKPVDLGTVQGMSMRQATAEAIYLKTLRIVWSVKSKTNCCNCLACFSEELEVTAA